MKRILVRCDARAEIGLGHVARSLAIAEALTARLGVPARFLSRSDPLVERFLAEHGVQHDPVSDTGYALGDVMSRLDNRSVLVSDSYELDAAALAAIAASGAAHVVVDDFAELAAWPCEVVVNPNVGAETFSYPGARTVLAGPRYALLRAELRALAALPRDARPAGDRLLVCFGGGAWPEAAQELLAALRDGRTAVRAATTGTVPAGVERVDPRTLPQQLGWADAAVLSGGVLKYEAAAVGVPAVLVAVVAHQEAVAATFAATGAADYAGSVEAVDPVVLAADVAELLSDARRRQEMIRAGHAVVDGRGAARVAEALLSAIGD
jgi:spore coat polysaccharide biosynthesis predicted glycosyltransferase SpsG